MIQQPERPLGTAVWPLLLASCFVMSCQQAGADLEPTVTFGNASAVGRWAPESGAAGDDADPSLGGRGDGTTNGVGQDRGGGAAGSNVQVGGGAGSSMGTTVGGTGGRVSVGATGGSSAGGRGGSSTMSSTGGKGAAGMSTGSAGMPATMGSGTLKFSVLTKSQGGRFTPKNIGAIWIEDQSGAFVKTLEIWARTRARYLSKFNAEAGANRVDAVTSATLLSHTTHNETWNLTDANHAAVPNGSYKVIVEVTDYDGTGKFTSVDFTVDGKPFSMAPPDTQYFTGMQLSYQ